MNTALKGCLLLAIAAAPAFAQTSDKQSSNAMNCPTMTEQMQKRMSGMMTDMRAMMEDTKDSTAKSRMQTMHERMSAVMANTQRMHGGMMGTAPDNPSGTAEAPTPSPDQRKENHEEHHPGP